MSLLTNLVAIPLLFAGLIALVPRNYRFGIRLVAIAGASLTLLSALVLALRYDSAPVVDGFRFVTEYSWLPSLGISFKLGVDGLNLGLLLMGAVVAFAATCAAWEIQSEHDKEFYVLLMVMIGGILGAFASIDLFFFYFFHELALVPTFIMIGVWGRGEKNYAAFKITIYLSIGALIALAGLILLYVQSGAKTFDLIALTRAIQAKPIATGIQQAIFPLLMFGFGILVSLWPFHTWAPLGYGCAPTPAAMLHAGVLKKFGLYGLIRIALPLLPEGAKTWLPLLAILCLGNILHCGWVAMRQRDLGLLIGNSSVAHMGFIFLGIASLTLVGVTGAVVVMVAHGLLAALSFALHGYLRHKVGSTTLGELGGLLSRMPFIGTLMVMALMAGCGVPGFANFAGEAMVLFGAWKGMPWYVVAAAWGALVIGAVYMLRAIRAILHGPLPERWNQVQDAGPWRGLPLGLLTALLLLLGVWPRLLVDRVTPSVEKVVAMATGQPLKAGAAPAARTATAAASASTRNR